MGKALCARLLSLQGEDKAETALNLLKAYGSFQAGMCLALNGESYTVYASTGMGGRPALSVPREQLKALERKNHYVLDPGEQLPGTGEFPAFSLDSSPKRFPSSILAIGGNQEFFNPGAVEAVIVQARRVFLPETPGEGLGIMETLASAHARFGAFQGVIARIPGGAAADRLQSAAGDFCLLHPLEGERHLVLMSAAEDGELLARHLAKTFNGEMVFNFRAENPQSALTLLKTRL
ncbi:MAG: hypothetical protein LBG84_07040 [Treponema sp.]|nr:hypothetical protein [Treponema sp.]